MSKILMREAETLVPVGRAALYRHAKEGKISTSKNGQGKTIVDIAELERFYGKLETNTNGRHKETTETDKSIQLETAAYLGNGHPQAHTEKPDAIALLQSQLEQTKTELADAKKRETKLLSMLKTEQEKTRLLMITTTSNIRKVRKPSFWNYFRLKK